MSDETALSTRSRDDVRQRLTEVAAGLLAEHGAAAVTTRAVAQAAGVQAPTIYRLFGDKDGLLEAVAEHVMSTYVTAKSATARSASADGVGPAEDLRAGWHTHVAFGLANPALFTLLHDPARAASSPATAAGARVLGARVHRAAAAGLLRVSEQRAAEVLHATGTGVVMALLARPPHERDAGLADAVWAATASAVLTSAGLSGGASSSAVAGPVAAGDSEGRDATARPGASGSSVTATAVALRAVLPDLPALSDGERALLAEWLDRSVRAGQG